MFIGMGSITSATLNNIAPYIGKIVSMQGRGFTYSRVKFSTATDPLVVTVVHADGTPFVDSANNPITRTHPLADISAMWEFGVEQPPSAITNGGAAVQASTIPMWIMPAGAIAIGLFIMWRSGFLAFAGIGPKSGRKSRKSRGRRSKR